MLLILKLRIQNLAEHLCHRLQDMDVRLMKLLLEKAAEIEARDSEMILHRSVLGSLYYSTFSTGCGDRNSLLSLKL
jgi:hypothetical protein